MTPRLLPLLALLALPTLGCGNDADVQTADGLADDEYAPIPDEATRLDPSSTDAVASGDPIAIEYASREGSAPREVKTTIPAAVPASAMASVELNGAPNHRRELDRSALPSGFNGAGTQYVFVEMTGDRAPTVSLNGWSSGGSTLASGAPYTGRVVAFTFPPLWPAGGPSPTIQLGPAESLTPFTLEVPAERPSWIQPIPLPATQGSGEPMIRVQAELPDDAALVLLYRQENGEWASATFLQDVSEAARRAKDDPQVQSGERAAPRVYRARVRTMNLAEPDAHLMFVQS